MKPESQYIAELLAELEKRKKKQDITRKDLKVVRVDPAKEEGMPVTTVYPELEDIDWNKVPVHRVHPNEGNLLHEAGNLGTAALNYVQKGGVQTLGAIADPASYTAFRVPLLDKDVDLTQWNAGAKFIAENPAARLGIARAYQGFNPTVAGSVGEKAIENNEEYLKGGKQLGSMIADNPYTKLAARSNMLGVTAEDIGDYGASLVQLGAQIAPSVVNELGTAAFGAKSAIAATPQLIANAPKAINLAILKAMPLTLLEEMAEEMVGEEEGQRLSTLVQTAKDPQMLLITMLTGLLAGQGVRGEVRAQKAASLGEVANPALPGENATIPVVDDIPIGEEQWIHQPPDAPPVEQFANPREYVQWLSNERDRAAAQRERSAPLREGETATRELPAVDLTAVSAEDPDAPTTGKKYPQIEKMGEPHVETYKDWGSDKYNRITTHKFSFVRPSDGKEFHIVASETTEKPGFLKINSVKDKNQVSYSLAAEEDANSMGVGAMKALVRQVKVAFPDMHWMEGFRVTGMRAKRFGGGRDMDVPIPRSRDVTQQLSFDEIARRQGTHGMDVTAPYKMYDADQDVRDRARARRAEVRNMADTYTLNELQETIEEWRGAGMHESNPDTFEVMQDAVEEHRMREVRRQGAARDYENALRSIPPSLAQLAQNSYDQLQAEIDRLGSRGIDRWSPEAQELYDARGIAMLRETAAGRIFDNGFEASFDVSDFMNPEETTRINEQIRQLEEAQRNEQDYNRTRNHLAREFTADELQEFVNNPATNIDQQRLYMLQDALEQRRQMDEGIPYDENAFTVDYDAELAALRHEVTSGTGGLGVSSLLPDDPAWGDADSGRQVPYDPNWVPNVEINEAFNAAGFPELGQVANMSLEQLAQIPFADADRLSRDLDAAIDSGRLRSNPQFVTAAEDAINYIRSSRPQPWGNQSPYANSLAQAAEIPPFHDPNQYVEDRNPTAGIPPLSQEEISGYAADFAATATTQEMSAIDAQVIFDQYPDPSNEGGGGSAFAGAPKRKKKVKPLPEETVSLLEEANAYLPGEPPKKARKTRKAGELDAQLQAYVNDPRTAEQPLFSVGPSPKPATEGMPAVAPPPPIPNIPPEMQLPPIADEAIKQVRNRAGNETRWIRLKKALVLPEFRATEMVAAMIRGYKAATHVANTTTVRVHDSIKDAYKAAGKEGQKIIDRFIHQNLSPEDIHPGMRVSIDLLPPAYRSLFDEGMRQNAQYRKELMDAGYFTPDQMAAMKDHADKGLVWLHRDYRMYMDKKYKPSVEHIRKAAEWLQRNSKTPMSGDVALQKIEAFIQGDGLPEKKMKILGLGTQSLRERQNIPKVLRDLLGEIRDPSYVLASSMAEIERLHFQFKATQAAMAPEHKGTVWDDVEGNPNMYPTPLWDENLTEQQNKQKFGALAGKYVSPLMHEALFHADNMRIKAINDSVVAEVVSAFKTAKVALSPVTFSRNWFSNTAYSAAAGLPIWNPACLPRLKQSWQAIFAYNSSFSTPSSKTVPDKGAAAWVQWGMEDGAIIPGNGTDMGGSQARQLAKELLEDPQMGVGGFFRKSFAFVNKQKAKGGAVYEMLDTNWRLAVYIEQVVKGQERLKLPLPEARARAARIVNENFASAGSVGPGIRRMGEKAGVFAPFLTWFADNMRVHAQWVYSMRKLVKDPQLLKRGTNSGEGAAQMMNLMLHYGMLKGAFALMRMGTGMSDEEVEEANKKLRTYQKTNVAWVEWLPYRDDKNRLQFIDLSALAPTVAFNKGDPELTPFGRVAMNMGLGLVQGGMIEKPVNTLMTSAGLAKPEYQKPIIPGQEGSRAVLDKVYEYMKPGIARDFENLIRRTDEADHSRQFEEKWTRQQGINRFPLNPLAAFSVEPVGRFSSVGVTAEKQAKQSELMRARGAVNRASPTTTDKVIDKLTGETRSHQLRLQQQLLEELRRRAKKQAGEKKK